MHPAFASATELAAMIRARTISSRELLELYLARVDRYNPALNAIVVDIRQQARKDAAEMDEETARGSYRGPFHGVPMTIKESYNVAGTATTRGNPAWKDNVPTEDAEAVKKMKAAGVSLFGKTNVPIALADFQSYNEVYGTTNNPWCHDRTPGGSSGGSAVALAAGLTGIEAGSDIGGSIRNPAHFCGVFGHKPTWNLLWMRGHSAPGDVRSTPDISVIGPMARSAHDLASAMRILASPDPIAARGLNLNLPTLAQRKLANLRVAVWRDDALCPVSRDVQTRVEQVANALRNKGAYVNDSARPAFSAASSHETYQQLLQATMASRVPKEDYDRLVEQAASYAPHDRSAEAEVFRNQTARFREWATANEARQQLRWRWHEFFQDYDVLLAPVAPTSAFPQDQRKFSERMITVDNQEIPYFQQLFWAGLSGVSLLPSTAIPTGVDGEGLPIGIQIIGPEYSDLVTIGVAQALEDEDGFRFTPPPAYVG